VAGERQNTPPESGPSAEQSVAELHDAADVEDTAEVEQQESPQPTIDPEIEARRTRALAFLRRFGDPILKSRATPVDRFDDRLQEQVSQMASLMSDALGVGLAAPQLGISQRLLVYRVGRDAPVIALVNPELEWSSDDGEVLEEGCLSIPKVTVEVERPIHVLVKALDEQGDERRVEASGLEARVIQHEIDHLDGILILDRTTKEQRKEAIRALLTPDREEQAA
jgi:peptide deformylase